MPIVTYIELSVPGSFFSESSTKKVKNRNPPRMLPKRCFGYRFYEQSEETVHDETLVGKAKNFSPMTYIGEIVTLEELKKQKKKGTEILISNLENNGYSKCVRTHVGNYQALEKDDTVIDPSTVVFDD